MLRELKQREARIKQLILAAARRAQAQHQQTFNGATGGFLDHPVNGPVTSPFGYRTHPIYGYYGLHNGTDFGAGCGSSLYAAASGTVIETYYDAVYGNRLYLSVGNVNGANLTLVYNHLSGYKVERGRTGSRAATWSATSARPAGRPAATCTSPCCATASPSIRWATCSPVASHLDWPMAEGDRAQDRRAEQEGATRLRHRGHL